MNASVSDTSNVSVPTLERLVHASDLAMWACAATGWSGAAKNLLRIELLTLRANLARYASDAHADARVLQPESTGDGAAARFARQNVDRLFAVPRILAARLAACGDDREELYRIRDEFQQFECELAKLDASTDLFSVDPRVDIGDDPASRPKTTPRFPRTWKFL
jgi:hypothetical protein